MIQEVPDELRDFVLRYIDSVAQLEALLLLRANPSQGWTSRDLAGRLYISNEDAISLLQGMREDGFVEVHGSDFRYTESTPEQQQRITHLAEFYASHIVAVTNLIHSKPRRIREFANAFRLKKD